MKHAGLLALVATLSLAMTTGVAYSAAVQIPPGKICDAATGDPDDNNNVCVIHVKMSGTTPSIKPKVFFNVPVDKHIVWKVTGNPRYGFKDGSIPIPNTATAQFDQDCATDNPAACPAQPGQWHKFYHWHSINPKPNQQHDYLVTLYPKDPTKAPIVVKVIVRVDGKKGPVRVDPTIVIQG